MLKTKENTKTKDTTITKFVNSKDKLKATLTPSNALKVIVDLEKNRLYCVSAPHKKKVQFQFMDAATAKKHDLKNTDTITLDIPYLLWGALLTVTKNKLVLTGFNVRQINFKERKSFQWAPWIAPNVYEPEEYGGNDNLICFGTLTPTSLRSAYNLYFNSLFSTDLSDNFTENNEDELWRIVEELDDLSWDAEDSKKESKTLKKEYSQILNEMKKDLTDYYQSENAALDEWYEDDGFLGKNYMVFEDCDGIVMSDSILIPENLKVTTGSPAVGFIKKLENDLWEVTLYKDKKNQVSFQLPTDRLTF